MLPKSSPNKKEHDVKTQKDTEQVDAYKMWAEWSPGAKYQKDMKLTSVVSVIVLATSAVQLMGLPTI